MNANLTVGQAIAWVRGTIEAVVGFLYWLSLLCLMVLFAAMVIGIFVRVWFIPSIPPTTFIYLAGAAWLLKR